MRRADIRIPLIIGSFCITMLSVATYAGELGEYEIKSGMLFNFASYVEWPSESSSNALGICIAGKSPADRSFKRIHGKYANGRKAVVRNVEGPLDTKGCNILFITGSENEQLPSYLRESVKKSILTVSDIPRFAAKGGIIGFIEEENKVRFEINYEAAKASRLKISSELLKLARIVRAAL